MNSEAQIIISFLFKRSGKDKLKESEIYLPLSLELGWFSTKESKDFVTYTIHQKLLVKKDGVLIPGFDIEKITVPVGFYPAEKSFAIEKTELKEEKNVVDNIVQKIVSKTGKKSEEILKIIKDVEIEKNIISEVAALFVAKNYNIDVDDYFDSVEKGIFRENEG